MRARTLSGLEGGDYSLQVTDRRPRAPRAAPDRPSAWATTSTASISDRSPIRGRRTVRRVHVRRLQLPRRARAIASPSRWTATTSIRSCVSAAWAGAGPSRNWRQNDDSGAGGLNSYLIFTAPLERRIRDPRRAAGWRDRRRLHSWAWPRRRRRWSRVRSRSAIRSRARWTSDDGGNDFGQRADAYTFTGTAGQRIVATMSSDAFDTYLELFSENTEENGGRYALDSDDDGAGEGTNSRLTSTLPADGQTTRSRPAPSPARARAPTPWPRRSCRPCRRPIALTFGADRPGRDRRGRSARRREPRLRRLYLHGRGREPRPADHALGRLRHLSAGRQPRGRLLRPGLGRRRSGRRHGLAAELHPAQRRRLHCARLAALCGRRRPVFAGADRSRPAARAGQHPGRRHGARHPGRRRRHRRGRQLLRRLQDHGEGRRQAAFDHGFQRLSTPSSTSDAKTRRASSRRWFPTTTACRTPTPRSIGRSRKRATMSSAPAASPRGSRATTP